MSAEWIRGLIILALALAFVVWLIVRSLRKAEDPARVLVKWIITVPIVGLMAAAVPLFGPIGPFVIVFCAVVFSILWTPHIAAAIFKPLTSMYDGGNIPPVPRPAYSVAQARQKQGRYQEAAIEIRAQLAKFPTDFEGHMLLAQLQAENLNDLAGAEATIEQLVAQPGHAPCNLAFALYSLADWHLQHAKDPAAARLALERVLELLPNSEFALGAAQRIAHLADRETLMRANDPQAIAVPEGVQNVGLLRDSPGIGPAEKDPAALANEYIKQLEQHPLDTEAREKLAILYLDHYGRLDLASGELEQLITMPHQPHRLVVHWLNLLADLQIRSGADYETVRDTLQRIIDLDPGLASASNAQSRIALLKLELKAKQKSQTVKLGSYEQNIGLKRGSFHKL
jgi:tetratricopeptide (TPR) repeat protein